MLSKKNFYALRVLFSSSSWHYCFTLIFSNDVRLTLYHWLHFTIIQVPHFQITLKRRPTNFIVHHRWSLHQVHHVLGGLCLIGDPSTLLIPDRQWSHQFPMEVCYSLFPSALMVSLFCTLAYIHNMLGEQLFCSLGTSGLMLVTVLKAGWRQNGRCDYDRYHWCLVFEQRYSYMLP